MLSNTPEKLLNVKAAAAVLNVTPQTLDVWRSTHRYPLPYVKIGRSVKYRSEDLERFINNNIKGAPTK